MHCSPTTGPVAVFVMARYWPQVVENIYLEATLSEMQQGKSNSFICLQRT